MDLEFINHEEFMNQLRNCRYCERFGIKPKPFVCKEKSEKSAKIVQISQEPSKGASESGIPFFDRSGKTLIKWYEISRETLLNPKLFYITGMAHCYSPDKKVRKELQQKCSEKWLRKELSYLNPCLYIFIGKAAADFLAKLLFPNKKFPKIDELVFPKRALIFRNRPAFVLPHPSPRSTWIPKHPEFKSERLKDIKNAVHEAIESKENV